MSFSDAQLSALARIRVRFLEKLADREIRLREAICVASESGPRNDQIAALKECKAILHQLAGSAGTVGFHQLGSSALSCEEEIRQHLDANTPSSGQVCDKLSGFLEDLAAMPERAEYR